MQGKKYQGRRGRRWEINPEAETEFKSFRKSGFFPVVKCPVKDRGPSVLVHTLSFKPGLSLEQKFNTLSPRESSIVLQSHC